MARKPGGTEHLQAARALLAAARGADELRAAQAVLLPLELGLSLEQTALAIGRSVSATGALRMRFCRVAAGEQAPPRTKQMLRNRAHATLEQEARLLAQVCGRGRSAGADLAERLKQAMQAAYGRPVATSSVYRLLQRHGWSHVDASAHAGAAAALPPGTRERRARQRARWIKA
jgi:hypothetical protein